MAYKIRQTGQQVQADLDKIEGVEAGAQVNVQSDWNESDPDSDAYIKNKPTIPVVPTNVSAFTNDAGYLTQHQDLSSLADGAEYDSNEKKIYLKHGSVRLANPIDATAFIKDGMVDSVDVSNGYLVITFNTDSGKQPISIPLSDIFNANNYYTKSEVDTALGAKQDALTFDSEPTAESDNPVTSGGVYDALQDIDIENMTEVTWAELKGLRDGGNLVKGNFYRITDYNCTTTQENTQSAGHQFDIVLLALSEDELAEEGWAMMHDNIYDVYFEDEDIDIKCYYYRFEELEAYLVTLDKEKFYYLDLDDNPSVIVDEALKQITLKEQGLTPDDFANMEEGVQYNYFQNSNLSAWKVWYCLDNNKSRFAWASDTEILSYIEIEDGQGEKFYQSKVDDKVINDIHYFCFKSQYQVVYTTSETPSIGDATYTYNSRLNIIGRDRDIVAFVEGAPLGTGVIYRLIDEFNNDIKYDFKNIQFKRTITDGQYDANGSETWCYTLNVWYNDMCQDASIVGNILQNDEGFVNGVYDNNFGYVTAYDIYTEVVNTFAFALGDNVVLSFDDDDGFYYGIYSNTIGNGFYSNTIGSAFLNNIIGNNFYHNRIGNDFNFNTIGNKFQAKKIGDYIYAKNYGNHGVELVADNNYVHTDSNYTSAEKTKLAGIASGAEVNVQSDWNQSNSSADDFIKNKPTIPTVPTNVSAFTNDAGYLNNNFCPIIEDTRSSAVAAITGVAPFSTLVDGQRIIVHLNNATANSTTINLTLSDNTTTGAKPLYSSRNGQVSQVGGNYGLAGAYIYAIYSFTKNRWNALPLQDANTTYPAIGQSNINQGTNINNGVITSKLLHDNAYIVEETYSSGSLKANKFYDFGTVSSALTIPSLDATNDLVSNALNFYALRFIAGADNLNITFPSGVIVDDEPTINTGDYVEIMINKYGNNFYASIKVWQAQ